MQKRAFLGIMLISVVVSTLTLMLSIQPADAAETIYIKADGSVDPPTAAISSADNVTYYIVGNISDSIVIERNNIIVDGNGYTLKGSGNKIGLYLDAHNVTIRNANIREYTQYGIIVQGSNNIVFGNNITDNGDLDPLHGRGYGIDVWGSNNVISRNNVVNNNGRDYGYGVCLHGSNHKVFGNIISSNGGASVYGGRGIHFDDGSSYNTVSGNNITSNGCGGIDIGVGIGLAGSYNIVSGNDILNNSGAHVGVGIETIFGYHNIISGNNVTNNGRKEFDTWGAGIGLSLSHNNTVCENVVANSGAFDGLVKGISVEDGSSDNIVCGNIVMNHTNFMIRGVGIQVSVAQGNIVCENSLIDNDLGVRLSYASDNTFFHNSFRRNILDVQSDGRPNIWDDGYPSGGNYWDSYPGEDNYSGPYQNVTGSDGLGDAICAIDVNNMDYYPLMNPYIAGDVNYDGIVNTSDLSALGSAYGSSPSSANWNSRADINKDLISNIIDLFKLGKNFGKTSE